MYLQSIQFDIRNYYGNIVLNTCTNMEVYDLIKKFRPGKNKFESLNEIINNDGTVINDKSLIP